MAEFRGGGGGKTLSLCAGLKTTFHLPTTHRSGFTRRFVLCAPYSQTHAAFLLLMLSRPIRDSPFYLVSMAKFRQKDKLKFKISKMKWFWRKRLKRICTSYLVHSQIWLILPNNDRHFFYFFLIVCVCACVFFPPILWCCHTGDHPQGDLAIFGYRPPMKVRI